MGFLNLTTVQNFDIDSITVDGGGINFFNAKDTLNILVKNINI